MNFLAHGLHFLDRPWFMAGTALPDWLSYADRNTRLRPRRVEPIAEDTGSTVAELAAGVLQHWHDDGWFHRSPVFVETTAQLGQRFRAAFDAGDNFRSGFLGHISLEMLLDAALAERDPTLLDRYYETLATLDPRTVESGANQMVNRPTDRLVATIERFRTDQFLRDYHDDDRLLYRLNRVLLRVKLTPLPAEARQVVGEGRKLVREHCEALISPVKDTQKG